jgi:hypothetical protein
LAATLGRQPWAKCVSVFQEVAMPNAHLYLFSDACPTDWLDEGKDDDWHTIVNFVHQSDPNLQPLVEQNRGHEEVLSQDVLYTRLVSKIQGQLPFGALGKWAKGFNSRGKPGRTRQAKERYQVAFCSGFAATLLEHKLIVSACSFQEKTLRAAKNALLGSYNQYIGGIEGRGIGFEEFSDAKGRRQMKHSFLNFFGYHEIQAPENQMLVLLLMSWFIADQFVFFFNDIVRSGRFGFDGLGLTVVSDKLSGGDDFRRRSEQNLRNLIDPDGEGVPLVLTRSPVSDTFSGDLLVDNLAGWLTSAMSDPACKHAEYARNLIPTGVWTGWRQLLPSVSKLEAAPAVSRLASGTVASQETVREEP